MRVSIFVFDLPLSSVCLDSVCDPRGRKGRAWSPVLKCTKMSMMEDDHVREGRGREGGGEGGIPCCFC